MGKPVLELVGVSKKFRKGEFHDALRDAIPALVKRLFGRRPPELLSHEFWALRDISFAVKPGEVLGIIGHNGAGKSTILKILSRVINPTLGNIKVNGSLSALIEVGAGFHTDLTGRQNIYLNGSILGMRRSEITKKLDRIIAFSGLEEFIDTPVKRYSTGMYARLGFAVAAHVDPEILIVDEVLSVGDFAFQNRCIARMKEIVKSGAAVVFVSHNLEAVSDLCTRAVLLDHGRLVKEGDPQDVIQSYLSGVQPATASAERDVHIANTTIRGRHGQKLRFEAGEEAWIDVDVTATHPCRRVSVTLYLRDAKNYEVFHTSSERLGMPAFSMEAGECKRVTFHVRMHLARGRFYVGTMLYRYDIEKAYDERFPAGILFVTSDRDVGGAANLYPEVQAGAAANSSAAPAPDHEKSPRLPELQASGT